MVIAKKHVLFSSAALRIVFSFLATTDAKAAVVGESSVGEQPAIAAKLAVTNTGVSARFILLAFWVEPSPCRLSTPHLYYSVGMCPSRW